MKTKTEEKKEDLADQFEHEMELSSQTDLVAARVGIEIHGMEEVPASIIPIPFVRLVQPTSTKIETVDGKEASAGTFYFNDTQRSEETIKVALLKGKHAKVVYERDGEKTPTSKLAILAYELVSGKLFILSLSVMSFSNYGRLMAQMKEKKISSAWEYAVTISSEKQENEKGKYYIAKFELNEELDSEIRKELENLYIKYGQVLNKKEEIDEV